MVWIGFGLLAVVLAYFVKVQGTGASKKAIGRDRAICTYTYLFSGQLIYPKWTFRADRPWGRSLVYVPGTTQKHKFWGVSVWGLQFGLRMVGNDFRRAFQGQRKAFLGCLFEERPCEASGEPS